MYFIGGDKDAVNPNAGTEEAYAKVHKIWTAANAGDKVKTEIVPGMEHAFPAEQQKAAFDWLDKQFK